MMLLPPPAVMVSSPECDSPSAPAVAWFSEVSAPKSDSASPATTLLPSPALMRSLPGDALELAEEVLVAFAPPPTPIAHASPALESLPAPAEMVPPPAADGAPAVHDHRVPAVAIRAERRGGNESVRPRT